MEYLLLFLAFPIIWPFIAKRIWHHDITYPEAALNVVVVILAVSAAWYAAHYSAVADTEILNGKVVQKKSERVSCEHSYEVCTGSGKDQSCTTHYEHSNDWNWVVYSTVNQFNIDRIDRQGKHEPPRWTKVAVGDPVAAASSFVNYIKGAPNTLFNKEEFKTNGNIDKVPRYPSNVYDYHYVSRVIPVGISIPNVPEWNMYLANSLRDVGPRKQVNVVILVTSLDKTFADAVKYRWLGGKKNDVVVVIGSKKYPDVEWVEVISWAKSNVFHVQLREDLQGKKLDSKDTIDTIINHINKGFTRMSMQEYEYLKHDIELPDWVLISLALFSVFGSVGVSIIMKQHDVI